MQIKLFGILLLVAASNARRNSECKQKCLKERSKETTYASCQWDDTDTEWEFKFDFSQKNQRRGWIDSGDGECPAECLDKVREKLYPTKVLSSGDLECLSTYSVDLSHSPSLCQDNGDFRNLDDETCQLECFDTDLEGAFKQKCNYQPEIVSLSGGESMIGATLRVQGHSLDSYCCTVVESNQDI